MITEPFFYNDDFYYSIDELIDKIVSEDCDINDLPEDYKIEATKAQLLPIIQYKAENLADMAEEFSEYNGEQEYEEILKAIEKHCDFEKLNSEIPKLWYENYSEKFTITKNDLTPNNQLK